MSTSGRSATDIGSLLNDELARHDLSVGLAHIFLKHTSASLMLCENADPTVLKDMETIMQRLAPDGDPEYRHNYEGDDDMAAHVRSVLTTNDMTLPITSGRLNLGIWQGIFLYEHRYRPHNRKIVLTVNAK
ncbi:MAG: secondary thiamine-phosphate synthase enzyme YjbQ [Arenicella sp.]|nr:secondary thiamine-phosphate synthase enzyme YjbQ [Arenicella sp.]